MAKKRKRIKAKRDAARAYEAAIATPSRRPPLGADLSADAAIDQGLARTRDWGRWLEENHDLAVGILDDLVKNIVGTGIVMVPKPLRADGTVDETLAATIAEAWSGWVRSCDVTRELEWHQAQRLACRAWLRDGEQFAQHVQGRARGFTFARDEIPYRIEMLESDMCPWDLTRDEWRQGIRHDAWRRPLEYAFYLHHPGDVRGFSGTSSLWGEIKTAPAEQILHLKLAKRWPQTRGISVLAPLVSRLFDLKDLEESERIKDRILASWAAVVTKAPELIGHENTDANGNRFMGMMGGTVIDSLTAGESITGVGAEYPVPNMPDHIADQIKRLAAGAGTRYSSISRNMDGSYASMRQELVEIEGHYRVREQQFVADWCFPIYDRCITTALLDGQLPMPADLDLRRYLNVEARGPVQPLADALKDMQADALAIERGILSLEQVQIKHGASPSIIGRAPAAAAPLTIVPDRDGEAA